MAFTKSLSRTLIFPGALLAALLLASCAARPRGYAPEATQSAPFLPPTAVSAFEPAASPRAETAEPPRPTPTPPCTPGLSFLKDLTIPDGTKVSPGEHLDKRWLVKNSGACNWDDTYRILLIAGPGLGAQSEQALFPARSSTQAVIRMNFIAPYTAGTYRSAWQAHDPEGAPFGDLFFIEFAVGD
jgi:hypothetical protein